MHACIYARAHARTCGWMVCVSTVSMRAMKKVKNYERQIQTIHSIMDNLEELKSQIESAEMNQRTMEVYKKASSFLKNNQMYAVASNSVASGWVVGWW
jgi:exonuclease VII small subunit